MWQKVAEEMAIPWRAAEAMHWQLGEQDMARRAGVTPFSLSTVSVDNNSHGTVRNSSSRGHNYSQSQPSLPRDMMMSSRGAFGRPPHGMPPTHPLPVRNDVGPPPPHLPPPPPPPPLEHRPDGMPYVHHGGPLAPIQTHSQQRPPGLLPSLTELTTGVSAYNTPAYSHSIPTASPSQRRTASPPGPFQSAASFHPLESAGSKRRRSPEIGPTEGNRRRQLDPRYEHAEHSVPRHMP